MSLTRALEASGVGHHPTSSIWKEKGYISGQLAFLFLSEHAAEIPMKYDVGYGVQCSWIGDDTGSSHYSAKEPKL